MDRESYYILAIGIVGSIASAIYIILLIPTLFPINNFTLTFFHTSVPILLLLAGLFCSYTSYKKIQLDKIKIERKLQKSQKKK